MPVRFGCPVCRAVLEVPDGQVGARTLCPKCRQKLQVPSAPPVPPANRTMLAQPFAPPDPPTSTSRRFLTATLVALGCAAAAALLVVCTVLVWNTFIVPGEKGAPVNAGTDKGGQTDRGQKPDPEKEKVVARLEDAADDLGVRFDSAFIGPVGFSDIIGRTQFDNRPTLHVILWVSNSNSTKLRRFRSWHAERGAVKLTDNHGNEYLQRDSTNRHYFIEGAGDGLFRQPVETIQPRKMLKTFLVFEPPVDAAESFTLQLRGDGGRWFTLRFTREHIRSN